MKKLCLFVHKYKCTKSPLLWVRVWNFHLNGMNVIHVWCVYGVSSIVLIWKYKIKLMHCFNCKGWLGYKLFEKLFLSQFSRFGPHILIKCILIFCVHSCAKEWISLKNEKYNTIWNMNVFHSNMIPKYLKNTENCNEYLSHVHCSSCEKGK